MYCQAMLANSLCTSIGPVLHTHGHAFLMARPPSIEVFFAIEGCVCIVVTNGTRRRFWRARALNCVRGKPITPGLYSFQCSLLLLTLRQTDTKYVNPKARRTLELPAELRGIRAHRLKAIAHVCAQILANFPAFETLRRESNVFDNFRCPLST